MISTHWSVSRILTSVAATAMAMPAAAIKLPRTDSDRAWGQGQEIRGEAAELMMAAFGRTAILDALDGPGLPLLRQRISD